MKILVLSDSHSAHRFMRKCVEKVKPDTIIHLGDHYDDGQMLAQLYPHIPVHQVPGNCDRYRCPETVHRMLCYPVGGVMLYMTHGHNERVKDDLDVLLFRARNYQAAAALYGHTHQPDCHKEKDGMWVLNPGSCGYGAATAGLMVVQEGQIVNCRILTEEALEENI